MVQDLTLPSKKIFKLCRADGVKVRNAVIRDTIAQAEADGYLLTEIINDGGDCLLKFELKNGD